MENQTEEWKDILGYEGYYQVSSFGRILSKDRIAATKNNVIKSTKGKICSLNKKENGYLTVMLCVNNVRKRFHVHRLVAEAFIPNKFNKPHVNHINHIRDCNKATNLEWVTVKENVGHCINANRNAKGDFSTSAKLSSSTILAIRRLYRINPIFNRTQIARKLHVRDTTIHKIIRNQRWKHI